MRADVGPGTRPPAPPRSVAWRPAAGLAGAWLALAVWQGLALRRESRAHRQALERSGRASIRVLEAALRAVGRGRRHRPGFLDTVLDDLERVPGVMGVWILDSSGDTIAERGPGIPPPGPVALVAGRWLTEGVLVGQEVDPEACQFGGVRGGGGAGGARWDRTDPDLAPGRIYLLLDRRAVDREMRADLLLRCVTLGVSAVALVGIWLFALARRRTRGLLTELAVSEERSRQNREWALLGAGLAHETKNPLAVVRSAAWRIATEGEGPGPDREAARQIVDEVDRVVARIGEFLRFSRPVEPRLDAIALRALASDVCGLVTTDLPDTARLRVDVDEVTVRADPDLLRQILLNLLVNAARALDEGGEIRVVTRASAAGRVDLAVEDDGAGMPEQDLGRVFEPYYSRFPEGTGLGLAIVRRLVEAQGWGVDVASRPEEGTTVTIRGIEVVT